MLRIDGVDQPVKILSGASLLQLKLLSAAFKLCPRPSREQILAIARHVAVSPEKLETWFQSRQTLHDWVTQQPQLQTAELAAMFYPEAAASDSSRGQSNTESPVPPAEPGMSRSPSQGAGSMAGSSHAGAASPAPE